MEAETSGEGMARAKAVGNRGATGGPAGGARASVRKAGARRGQKEEGLPAASCSLQSLTACGAMCVLMWILAYGTEKAMAPHSSTLAWKHPWTEEPGGLQSMGSLRVRHD